MMNNIQRLHYKTAFLFNQTKQSKVALLGLLVLFFAQYHIIEEHFIEHQAHSEQFCLVENHCSNLISSNYIEVFKSIVLFTSLSYFYSITLIFNTYILGFFSQAPPTTLQ